MVERLIRGRRNGVTAGKVRIVEEQVEVRGSLKAIWCKGSKDASIDETDNGEIPRRWCGAKVARSGAKEERAVERQIRQRWIVVIAAMV